VRILLDECVPARLARAFPDHAVQSVTQIGWRSSKDGPLLEFAQGRFDVFVTVDRQLEKQNDLSKLKLGFVIARVLNNRLDGFLPIFDELNTAAQNVRFGEVIYVASPEYSSR
jgi:predicted nuclease of predicted toxin-antitoxin system